jgi:hypothetical protein
MQHLLNICNLHKQIFSNGFSLFDLLLIFLGFLLKTHLVDPLLLSLVFLRLACFIEF